MQIKILNICDAFSVMKRKEKNSKIIYLGDQFDAPSHVQMKCLDRLMDSYYCV